MGICVDQYRVTIGLYVNKYIVFIIVAYSCPSVGNQICWSFGLQALLILNIILSGLSCFRHFLMFLYIFFLSAIDVHTNPGPSNNQNNQLKLCHSNIRSLKSPGKLEEVQLLAESANFNIITLSETWLDVNYPNQLLLLDNFQPPFCKDRDAGRGGGVLTYIHSSLPCVRRSDLECHDSECVWVEISTVRGKVLIGNYYRPPGQPAEIRDSFLRS